METVGRLAGIDPADLQFRLGNGKSSVGCIYGAFPRGSVTVPGLRYYEYIAVMIRMPGVDDGSWVTETNAIKRVSPFPYPTELTELLLTPFTCSRLDLWRQLEHRDFFLVSMGHWPRGA